VQDFYQQYFKDLKPIERARNFSHPLNKIEELLRPALREFLCQKKSLNFQSIMDRQKILLCRVPKGLMGERPAKVLGSLILSKINLASFRRKKRNKQFLVIVDEVHNFTDGIDFETMLAESRKFGIHYLFVAQTTQPMRDEERKIFNDQIAFGNREIAEQLMTLPNYQFVAFTTDEGQPVLSDPVLLTERPEAENEVPARNATAWAMANTGTPKTETEKQIGQTLRM
jgi:type IV secretory pathway TraG/TraD family ATPase VirD4